LCFAQINYVGTMRCPGEHDAASDMVLP